MTAFYDEKFHSRQARYDRFHYGMGTQLSFSRKTLNAKKSQLCCVFLTFRECLSFPQPKQPLKDLKVQKLNGFSLALWITTSFGKVLTSVRYYICREMISVTFFRFSEQTGRILPHATDFALLFPKVETEHYKLTSDACASTTEKFERQSSDSFD